MTSAASRHVVEQQRDATRKIMTSNVTDDHGTPRAVVRLAHETMGGIDLDPMSSSYWNHHVVQATTFYDERINGMIAPLFGRTFCNPAGATKDDPSTRALPKRMWERVTDFWRRGEVDCIYWVGFSLQQLQQFQSCPVHPLQFITLFPCERLRFLRRGPNGGPPVEGDRPVHANYVTFVPPRKSRSLAAEMTSRFVELGSRLDYIAGALVRPIVRSI